MCACSRSQDPLVSARPAWVLRRVLPIPGGPVSVSKRTSGRSNISLTSATSPSLPIRGVDGAGKLWLNERGSTCSEGCLGKATGEGCDSECDMVDSGIELRPELYRSYLCRTLY